MQIKNRLFGPPQADYLFIIVRPSRDWQPTALDDVPDDGEILSVDYVASFDEAREDLIRCNHLALRHQINKWAIVQSTGGEL